ncbi:1-phosphatidylinositol 3-phosphate 5-kinase-like isoform X3 [Dreissena polymorpha]|uniref:1-phosphatidylinositol 3-phosphate 5-kinase-like isoform X3 n=1 Tax=Dreissena polymorpha TaxID=45954 RepID=UPI0022642379|nr:1-phosphatidylinositol 3-phosphate 5-kinase-like isoform X3 [Dreissena polymorpha]
MSLWEDIPTSLTSFGPITSESESSGGILSRIFKRGKDDSDNSAGSSKVSSREVSVDRDRASRGERTRASSVDRAKDQLGSASSSPNISRQCSPATLTPEHVPEVKVTEARLKEDTTKRTLGSVLTRLSAIVENRQSTPQVYRDSDFKQYWMPDSSCRECYECGDRFTTFRRRHHCRICGQIFCNSCCCQELPGKIIGYKGSIRVCRYCLEVVLQYAQKADPNSGVTRELLARYMHAAENALSPEAKKSTTDQQRSLSLRSPSEAEISAGSAAPFDLTPQSEFVMSDNFPSDRMILLKDSQQLRSLWMMMTDPETGLEFQNFRVRLRNLHNCIHGNRIVDWLLKHDKVSDRSQAIAIGQALIDAAFLSPLQSPAMPFRDDYTLFRPTEVLTSDTVSLSNSQLEDSLTEDSAPLWFQQIQSTAHNADQVFGGVTEEDINKSENYSNLSHDSSGEIKVDERHFEEPVAQPVLPSDVGADQDGPDSIFGTVAETERTMATAEVTGSFRTIVLDSGDPLVMETFEKLQLEHHEHLTLLTRQLLQEAGLSGGWADTIISTVDKVSMFVKPDVKHNMDDMDIRKYVHIKKIPGGKREQTALTHGVMFNKNIAHRKMSHKISDPSVLLLAGSIEYQRVENKMSYLEPQILQEEEFLWKNIKKITSLAPKPNILVVEKSVSRLAQDFILKAGITLIYNVKQSVMLRLSRLLDTDIAASIESLMGRVKVGFCHGFSVKNFTMPMGETKSLVCFDGCATHLGCTVILRGGSISELKKVKLILNYMIYASYHSRLEIAFCMDEFLKPPQKDDIDFDFSFSQKKNRPKQKLENAKEPKDTIENYSKDKETGNDLEVTDTELKDVENKNPPSVQNDKNPERVNFFFGENDSTLIRNADTVSDNVESADTSLDKQSANNKITEGTNSSSETVKSDRRGSFLVLQKTNKNDDIESGSSSNQLPAKQRSNSMQNAQRPGIVLETGTGLNRNQADQSSGQQLDLRPSLDRAESQPDFRSRHSSGSRRDRSPNPQRRSASTQLTDNSDPLTKYQNNQDESIFQSSLALKEQNVTHRTKFKKSLENTVLSTSPYIKYQLPYLETETGSRCELRRYLPPEIYWSTSFSEKQSEARKQMWNPDIDPSRKPEPLANVVIRDPDEFICRPLVRPASNYTTQCLLAKFRAYGGRIDVIDTILDEPRKNTRKGKEKKTKGKQLDIDIAKPDNSVPLERKVDCLDTFSHQRIAVLFSSFSYLSENHPSPCVYPWQVTMEFYGRNDTTLGEFLERFCFRPSYICPSESCNTSMDLHIRRFVHGHSCISLILKRSSKDKQINIGNNIQIWSWCHRCKQATPRIPMSEETWNLSFARYLELRFHGDKFVRRNGLDTGCYHSLHHDNFQYFGLKDTVAAFKYSAIKLKEIRLPSLVIDYQFILETIQLYRHKDELKRLSRDVTDLFDQLLLYTCSQESEVFCENVARMLTEFKVQQKVEKTQIQEHCIKIREVLETLISEVTQVKDAKVVTLTRGQLDLHHAVEDGLVNLKRTIAEGIIRWNNRLVEFYSLQKKSKQASSSTNRKSQEPVSFSLGSVHQEPVFTGSEEAQPVSSSNKDTVYAGSGNPKPFRAISSEPKFDTVYEAKSISDETVIADVLDTETDNTVLSQDLNEPLPVEFLSKKEDDVIRDMNEDSLFVLVSEVDSVEQENVIKIEPEAVDVKKGQPVIIDNTLVNERDIISKISSINDEKPAVWGDFTEATAIINEQGSGTFEPIEDSDDEVYEDALEKRENDCDTVADDKEQYSGSLTQEEAEKGYIVPPLDSLSSDYLESIDGVSNIHGGLYLLTGGGQDFNRRTSDYSLASLSPPQGGASSTLSDFSGSYCYGITPGISAVGVIPPSLEADCSYVVCHREDIGVMTPPALSDEESAAKQQQASDVVMETQPLSVAIATNEEASSNQGVSLGRQYSWDTGPVGRQYSWDTGPVDKPWQKGGADDGTEGQAGDRKGVIQTIKSTIWQGSGAFQLQSPFELSTHNVLPACEQVPVIVYDHEPSSIIAYSLSCRDYHMKLGEIQAAKRSSHMKADTESLDKFPWDEQGNTDDLDYPMFTASVSEQGEKGKTASTKTTINHHIELQFFDSTARFYCKVYFADHFRHLRKHVFPEGESVFIRSLCRCKPWEASGGKSGSSFCKTFDDRFILKQMSSMEVESFEKFGPEYFQYMASVEKQQKPTALAKIVGVYRIGFRNQHTNNANKQDLIILENLFYNRCISQTFDLKGSERNRMVKQSRKRAAAVEELVLLDENFLRVSVDTPLYIMPHSKTVLQQAISEDSQFLATNLVMDYSLLVGLDEQRRELVVGIIDYIRTFTWDKKLETILKSQFGGQGKMPTVVSPEVYRTRFLDAMSKYFLAVPDQWSGLGTYIES